MESRRSRSLLLLFPRFPLMVQRLLVPSLPVLNLLGNREVGAGGENPPATRLGIFSVGLDLRDGLVQRYVTQPLLSLLCVVSLAHRELIEKTNGVNNTHLFKENVSGSTANFRYGSGLHVHMSSSNTSSVGDATLVSNPFKVLVFRRNLSSQVQK